MRRTIAGAIAVAALVPAAASAATQTYEGEIKGDAKAVVELEVETRGGRRAVTEFRVRRFPLECEGGTVARLDRARLAGTARVSGKGRFELEASDGSQRLQVHGRLARSGEASGTVKYSGLTEFADETRECRTDRLRWAASR